MRPSHPSHPTATELHRPRLAHPVVAPPQAHRRRNPPDGARATAQGAGGACSCESPCQNSSEDSTTKRKSENVQLPSFGRGVVSTQAHLHTMKTHQCPDPMICPTVPELRPAQLLPHVGLPPSPASWASAQPRIPAVLRPKDREGALRFQPEPPEPGTETTPRRKSHGLDWAGVFRRGFTEGELPNQ